MTIKFDDIEDESTRKILEDPAVLTKIQAKFDSFNAGVTAKNQELLNELKTVKSFIEEHGGIEGIKSIVSETAAAKKAREAAEMEKARTEGNVKEIEKKYSEQLSSKEQELQSLRSTIVDKEVKNVLNGALSKAKASDLLEPFIRSRVKGSFGSNGIDIEVLNENGSAMLTSKGEKATIDDLVEEFKSNTRYHSLFAAPGKSGSGTESTSLTDESYNPFDMSHKDFNLTKAMEFYRSNPEKAKKLAAKVNFKLA